MPASMPGMRGGRGLSRIARAHHEVHVHLIALRQRKIHHRFRRLLQGPILPRSHDADDLVLDPLLVLQPMTDRVRPEVPPRQHVVDDDDRLGERAVAGIEQSSFDERDPHRLEISGRRHVDLDLESFQQVRPGLQAEHLARLRPTGRTDTQPAASAPGSFRAASAAATWNLIPRTTSPCSAPGIRMNAIATPRPPGPRSPSSATLSARTISPLAISSTVDNATWNTTTAPRTALPERSAIAPLSFRSTSTSTFASA